MDSLSAAEQQSPRGEVYRPLLKRADSNRDGVVTRAELSDELLRTMDTDRDGSVSWTEALRARGAMAR